MGSTIYTEVFVVALVLVSNVLGNNLIGYIPRTATEIAARPQVPSPKLLLQVRKFRQQMMGCFTLQPLQQSADRYLRRNRKEQMHMIVRYVPLHYLHFVLPQISRTRSSSRTATSPVNAGRRYFVIHTRCK